MDFASLPSAEKPREKLLAHGPASLSLAELVAVLLRTGRTGEDVVEMSRNLIVRMGGLEGLARATTAELMQEKGLKKAKAASLAAALELGKRMSLAETPSETDCRAQLEAKAVGTG
jgi:DNA repair protein RadC